MREHSDGLQSGLENFDPILATAGTARTAQHQRVLDDPIRYARRHQANMEVKILRLPQTLPVTANTQHCGSAVGACRNENRATQAKPNGVLTSRKLLEAEHTVAW